MRTENRFALYSLFAKKKKEKKKKGASAIFSLYKLQKSTTGSSTFLSNNDTVIKSIYLACTRCQKNNRREMGFSHICLAFTGC